MRDGHRIRYINCGDWVESCTAVVKHDDGQFEIVKRGHSPLTGAPAPLAVRVA